MPKYSKELDHIFQALSDATRRKVLEQLKSGPASTSELAAHFDMALPSFFQHLQMLEKAALVESQKKGRVRTYALSPGSMKQARHWLDAQLELWEQRLDQFDAYVTKLHKERNDEL